jgi:hypothetical protein
MSAADREADENSLFIGEMLSFHLKNNTVQTTCSAQPYCEQVLL